MIIGVARDVSLVGCSGNIISGKICVTQFVQNDVSFECTSNYIYVLYHYFDLCYFTN